MKLATRYSAVALAVIASLVVTAAGLALLGRAQPAQAAYTSTNTVVLLNAQGITQTTTSPAQYLPGYTVADCYANIVLAGAANTTTIALQHGALTDLWANAVTIGSTAADATFFTRTLAYGNYQRVIVTPLTSTVPVTVTVVCAEKN